MIYFYLVIGKSKPKLFADNVSWPMSGKQREATLAIGPSKQKKMDFGRSSTQPKRQALQNNVRDGGSRPPQQQYPACLIPGGNRLQGVHPERRRLTRTRSATQLRDDFASPTASHTRKPFPHPSAPSSEPDILPLCFCGFDPNKEHERMVHPPQKTGTNGVSPISENPRCSLGEPQQRRLDIHKPLPTSPSRYRLGDDNLPWTTAMDLPSWLPEDGEITPQNTYVDFSDLLSPLSPFSASGYAFSEVSERSLSTHRSLCKGDTISSFSSGHHPRHQESYMLEDPQRNRDLSNLQQAMMTIDSMDSNTNDAMAHGDDNFEVAGPASGSTGLGWAVRAERVHNIELVADLDGTTSTLSPEQWK